MWNLRKFFHGFKGMEKKKISFTLEMRGKKINYKKIKKGMIKNMKKIIPILAASMILQSFSGLGIVHASGSSYPLTYSFDSGMDGWEIGESTGNPTLTHETEDGNGYLKLKAAEGSSYNLKNGINIVPNGFIELETPFTMEKNAETVVSIDVRTSDMSTFVRGLMMNRDQLDSTVENELQYNLATLWGWNRSNVLSTYERDASRSAGPYKRALGTDFAEDVLENGKWYTFKTVLYTDDSALPQYMKVTVSDEDGIVADTEKIEIENAALKLSKNITRLDIALMHSTVTVPEGGADVDIDNVKIYTVTNERTWGISGLPENGVFTNIEDIGISFSGKMDATTLNDTNIKLVSEDGEEVEYTAEYNDISYIYTIFPKSELLSGRYSVVVEKSAINGIDEDGNTISGMAEIAKDSIGFRIFNGSLPEAKNLKVTGKLKENSVVRASAEYYQAEGLDGYLEYQWYYADEENGDFSAITDADTAEFTVSSEYTGKFIKCSVNAVTDDGIKGEKVYSDILKPLTKPEAKNVEVSGMIMTGMQVTVSYEFYDENSDSEGKSRFKWFVSDNGSDNWQEIEGETANNLTLDDSFEGKYIKAGVIPVSVDEPYEGDLAESAKAGPVTGKDSLNLATNPGFETGTNKGWGVRNMSGDTAAFVATQEDAYSGEWSGKLSGQTNNSTFPTHPVKVKKGIKYIVSTMVKVAPDSAIDTAAISYYGEGYPTGTVVTRLGSTTATKDEWKQLIAFVDMGADSNSFTTMPQYFAGSGGKGAVFYYDDYYFAPLLVDNIITSAPESMNIPTSGEVSSTISVLAIRNQLGTTDGLENEAAYWEVDAKGVYVKDNKLYVTSEAVSGTINLKAVVEPSFEGATQSIYVKNIPIELVTNSNKTPKVSNVLLSGDTTLGSTVTLSYDFYQVDGFENKSIIKWYVSDTESGTYSLVEDFSGRTLDISAEYEDKFIKAEITPVDSEGREGAKVTSNIAGPKRAPEAKNVTATGKGYVGDILKGSYEYYDFNGDKEGETVIKWLKAGSKNGTYKEIAGANSLEYTVTEEDVECWFKMEVTPVAENDPYNGETVLSEALQGPTAPTVTDVEITKSGKILTGKYKYENVNGVGEGKTICEWLINGSVVETGTSYTIDFSGTKSVEFRVTPVAVLAPFKGESVSVTKSVSGGSTSGGGGGGGSSGSKVSSTILPALPQTQPDTSTIDLTIADIAGHWSENYAKEAVEKGIMPVDSAKNFYPDKKVTRAEMITYIFKAMGYSETEYRNEFQDVTAAESYAKMLQTMVDKGIISKDVNFRPNDNVTRQEVCKILSIALGFTESEFDLTKYTDNSLIGDWAVPYVKNIINSNLMIGVSATEFSPRTNITNGQIAKIVSMIHSGNYTMPISVE